MNTVLKKFINYMDFKSKQLYLLLLIMTSCVSTNFDAYQSLDNLRIKKEYYEINEPEDNKNYVTIGIHTIINRQNDYYIYVAFKNKLSTLI